MSRSPRPFKQVTIDEMLIHAQHQLETARSESQRSVDQWEAHERQLLASYSAEVFCSTLFDPFYSFDESHIEQTTRFIRRQCFRVARSVGICPKSLLDDFVRPQRLPFYECMTALFGSFEEMRRMVLRRCSDNGTFGNRAEGGA